MLALEDLIARLEREAGTSGTSPGTPDVPEKAARTLARTPRTSGTSENDKAERVSAAIALHAPPPSSPVARIAAAGGTSRIGGAYRGAPLSREAELPADAPAELAADLEREGWHVRRIMAAAERAAPRPDLDPAEWQGEVE